MIPSTIVEHDSSGLEMVLDAMDELLEEKFIEGIRNKHHDVYEIKQNAEQVKIYQHRMNIEANALTRFSEKFIRSFATPNNKCFNTAETLFSKIKSTISSLKKVFYKTTARDYTQLPEGVESPSVFNKSPLGHGDYTPDVFGLESFPKEVQELYQAIETLFATATTMLALCHLMIEEEDKTRNDIVQLRQIYQESCNELLGAVKAASTFCTTTEEMPENELEERRKKIGSDNDERFLKAGYHSVDKEVMTQFLIMKTIREARHEGLTDIEAFFWHKDREKALQVRKIVENFDFVDEVLGQSNSLSSIVMVEFLKYCDVPESLEKQLYTQYFLPKYLSKGKHKPLGWNTISGKRKEVKEMGDTNEKLANDFKKRLSAIFPSDYKKETQMLDKSILRSKKSSCFWNKV